MKQITAPVKKSYKKPAKTSEKIELTAFATVAS